MDLCNKVAIVTGAASGLGAATCRLLAEAGAKVVGVDIDVTKLKCLEQEVGKAAITRVANVADEDAVRAVIEAAVDTFGALHIAVNCAGVVDAAKTVSKGQPFPRATWDKVIGINLTGTFNVIRLAALAMMKNAPEGESGERGVIINTASGAAWQGQVGQAAYSASKAGVMGLTLPVARDLAEHGIRVVSIAPGMFDTAMAAALPEKVLGSIVERMILYPNRMGRPAEFAGLVRHIVENSYMNATTISLDGGARISTR
ncbi:MAG: SDR family NAD(P)-dependent oxidoreductase [Hyphomonadaceae bacterium]|nr:SDR family NAD(P)-dependent oxidoreductase [Hyphomonadaceae bacterium]